jgi:hypothetical protein
MIQFGLYDKQNRTEIAKITEKTKKIGLDVVQRVKKRGGKEYIAIQSRKALSWAVVKQMIALAKSHRLEYYYYPVSAGKVPQDQPGITAEQPLHEENSAVPIFGHNTTLLHLMEDGLDFRKDMLKTKEEYLALYEAQFHKTALEARLTAERAFSDRHNGYEVGIAWDMLENGYFGSRKKAYKKRLQRSIAFDYEIEDIISNYSQVAYYEIKDIKRTIAYYYEQRRNRLLKKALQDAAQRVRIGTMTRMDYDKLETEYEKSCEVLDHIYLKRAKPFDTKYRSLISTIETKKLLNAEKLKRLTLQNAPSLKIEQQKLKAATLEDKWTDHIKAEFYLNQKQYTFVEREETLGGVQLRIPLDDFKEKEQLVKLEREYTLQKIRSLRLFLGKEVTFLYDNIAFHKERIGKLKQEKRYQLKLIKHFNYKNRHPVRGDIRVSEKEQFLKRVQILELERDIWLERADILGALLKLQYLSGVRLLR